MNSPLSLLLLLAAARLAGPQDIKLSGEGMVAEVPRHGTYLIRVWPTP